MKRFFAFLICCMFLLTTIAFAEEITYFPEDLAEFESEENGLFVLYPSALASYASTGDDDSILLTAELPDGSASLTISRLPNEGNLVNETWIAISLQENPDAMSNINEATGTSSLMKKNDQMTTYICCLFHDGWQYQVELTWNASHEEDFAPFMSFISNSLSIDELDIG